jgi:hypothetical protein
VSFLVSLGQLVLYIYAEHIYIAEFIEKLIGFKILEQQGTFFSMPGNGLVFLLTVAIDFIFVFTCVYLATNYFVKNN